MDPQPRSFLPPQRPSTLTAQITHSGRRGRESPLSTELGSWLPLNASTLFVFLLSQHSPGTCLPHPTLAPKKLRPLGLSTLLKPLPGYPIHLTIQCQCPAMSAVVWRSCQCAVTHSPATFAHPPSLPSVPHPTGGRTSMPTKSPLLISRGQQRVASKRETALPLPTPGMSAVLLQQGDQKNAPPDPRHSGALKVPSLWRHPHLVSLPTLVFAALSLTTTTSGKVQDLARHIAKMHTSNTPNPPKPLHPQYQIPSLMSLVGCIPYTRSPAPRLRLTLRFRKSYNKEAMTKKMPSSSKRCWTSSKRWIP